MYQKTFFFSDLAWEDRGKMLKDPRGRIIAGQLIDSAGSISANMEEGHGRGFGKQRQYFLRVALGSARESKGWYQRSHYLLTAEVLDHRLALLDGIIALLVTELKLQARQDRPVSQTRLE